MKKINAVLVMLNSETLEETLGKLNLDNVNLASIVADTEEKFFQVGENRLPIAKFSAIHKTVKPYKDYFWLISGSASDDVAAYKLKNFLMTLGVSRENIIRLEFSLQISDVRLANLRHIEENGADFFATGSEYIQSNLDLEFIPCVQADKNSARGGVNLAGSNQNLRQSYLTAKRVFEHVTSGAIKFVFIYLTAEHLSAHVLPGTIKFVLIGLEPDSFRQNNDEAFAEENTPRELLENLLNDEAKKILQKTSAQADLNFESIKTKFNRVFSAKAIVDWETSKPLADDFVELNIQTLKDYIELCLINGAKPIGVIFPFAPAVRKNFNKEFLKQFRETIYQLEKDYDFTCVDMFELNLGYENFADMTHLNSTGTLIANSLLAFRLYKKNLIPVESFCGMNYESFYQLSRLIDKEKYNALMDDVFKKSLEKIRAKNKIKIGFVAIEAAQWCGNELYNLFANNSRFEVTVFLSVGFHKDQNEIVTKDFSVGVEQLKSHGLNVVALDKLDMPVPAQDILIFLTPYLDRIVNAFSPKNMTPKTLITYIPYTFETAIRKGGFYGRAIYSIVWRLFFSSIVELKMCKKNSVTGMPHGIYSGHPRVDFFFKNDSEFQFDWKMVRPDAVKIIWAPHHSIIGSKNVKFATFQWNYKFMYDFAKAHPETSWIVKPHPWLLYQAVNKKVFPSPKAFQKYLQAWNDLPNAQVYTGAYYQNIFSTSDGIIHDYGSFIAEYQFVDKPMIFLTRAEQRFNELGEEILKASYTVDGENFKAIAETIQKVFIEGDDYKATERREVFNKYLNYPRANGMLASEFIYKNLAEELRGL